MHSEIDLKYSLNVFESRCFKLLTSFRLYAPKTARRDCATMTAEGRKWFLAS